MRPTTLGKISATQSDQTRMARPFDASPATTAPLRPSVPQRPELHSPLQNRYAALTEVPKLPPPMPTKLVDLKTNKPVDVKTNKPFDKGSSSGSSVQSKQSYTMKTPESFAQAVDPAITQAPPTSPVKEEFKFITTQVIPIIALDKAYEGYPLEQLIKPVYNDKNFVDTESPLKTRRFYEAILVDTDSIEVEHTMDERNPEFISYSRFTIKRVLTPFNWFVDHLHTPIALSMPHRPQTYNWYDYKSAWFNFLYVRPGHTWFVKYCPAMLTAIIPRWFYEWWGLFGGIKEILPQQFLSRLAEFCANEGCLTLPEHIQMCKFFIKKRVSYIISWNFAKGEQDRITYLSKEIKVKGWTPKPAAPRTPVKGKSPVSSSGVPKDKQALKERLKKALNDLESQEVTDDVLQLLEEASSSSSGDNNGDMLAPKGIARAYMDPY